MSRGSYLYLPETPMLVQGSILGTAPLPSAYHPTPPIRVTLRLCLYLRLITLRRYLNSTSESAARALQRRRGTRVRLHHKGGVVRPK
eukprot:2242959-Rhodomonas_salina.1